MKKMAERRTLFAGFCICLFVLICMPACQKQPHVIQNQDDGILVIDAEHSINFYLGNDKEGTDPITQQGLMPTCQEQPHVIQNQDDGILAIDAEHSINFYLGNDEEGTDPITQQCLPWIENQEPVSVETEEVKMEDDGFLRDTYSTYQINGVMIQILEEEYDSERQAFLLTVDLDAAHALESGIRIGSTEEELKKAYEGRSEVKLSYMDMLSEQDTEPRYYVLFGDWYMRYIIWFKVDSVSGCITKITYAFDE